MSKLFKLTAIARSVFRGNSTELGDVIVPSVFAPYVQNLTATKTRIISSGAMQTSEVLTQVLVGEGSTFTKRFYKDLEDTQENVSEAQGTNKSTPNKIKSGREIQVRCSRNNSWGSADLLDSLVSPDPLDAIYNLVAGYRARVLQRQVVALVKGIYAMNAADPVTTGNAASTHTKNDMTHDISGSSFSDGVTNFNPAAFILAAGTMGDSMEELTMVMMHSIVYQRLQLLNLIDFIPDSRGEVMIKTYMGREVIVDDGIPYNPATHVTEVWLFGAGALQYGAGSPKVPVETKRDPDAYNGGGAETLFNRWENIIHCVGHAWVGTAGEGGPTNAELSTAANWARVFPERKQIRMARLITREA